MQAILQIPLAHSGLQGRSGVQDTGESILELDMKDCEHLSALMERGTCERHTMSFM